MHALILSCVYKYSWLFTVRWMNRSSPFLFVCVQFFSSFFVLSFRFVRRYGAFFFVRSFFRLSLKLNYRNYLRLSDLIYICKNIKRNTDHVYVSYCIPSMIPSPRKGKERVDSKWKIDSFKIGWWTICFCSIAKIRPILWFRLKNCQRRRQCTRSTDSFWLKNDVMKHIVLRRTQTCLLWMTISSRFTW